MLLPQGLLMYDEDDNEIYRGDLDKDLCREIVAFAEQQSAIFLCDALPARMLGLDLRVHSSNAPDILLIFSDHQLLRQCRLYIRLSLSAEHQVLG